MSKKKRTFARKSVCVSNGEQQKYSIGVQSIEVFRKREE